MPIFNITTDLGKLPKCDQRQDSVQEQLRELSLVGDRLGLFDAADVIRKLYFREAGSK